jgi:hypothetical protein
MLIVGGTAQVGGKMPLTHSQTIRGGLLMTERREFLTWEGEAVQVFYPGGNIPADYGVLEEVNDWGLVLRSRRTELREVSEFRPWHVVGGVRLLEEEQRKAHGL